MDIYFRDQSINHIIITTKLNGHMLKGVSSFRLFDSIAPVVTENRSIGRLARLGAGGID